MESKVNYAIVGLFVLVLGTALIAGALWVSSGKRYGQRYDTYVTYMSESVAGLNANAPVKFRGVDVGFVRGIELDAADIERVQLTLSLRSGTPVREDTTAVLGTQGLTGIAYLDLVGGHNGSPPLRPRPGQEFAVIRSGPSLLARLDTAVTALVASATHATDNLGTLLDDDNRRTLAGALADLRVVSGTLAARSRSIDAALADASRAMRNAAQFSEDLPRLAARVERSADGFDRMSEAVARAAASGAQAFDGTRAEVQQFASTGVPEMRELVAELREVTRTLQRVSTDVERNPGILVWGRPQPTRRGPGE